MTTSPTLTNALPRGTQPSPNCTHRSRSVEEMEEKENVNQNLKITEFLIQNIVCFLLGLLRLALRSEFGALRMLCNGLFAPCHPQCSRCALPEEIVRVALHQPVDYRIALPHQERLHQRIEDHVIGIGLHLEAHAGLEVVEPLSYRECFGPMRNVGNLRTCQLGLH